jgi:zinc finger SWIM domain-containing protein 3
MEAEGYVSLEEINECNSVANHTLLREQDFYEFYNNYAKY